MTEYARGVFAICAVVSVCSLFVYGEKKDFATRLALSTLVVYAALMPIFSLLSSSDLDASFDYEFDVGEYSEDYLEVAEKAFCEGIRRLVVEKYALDADGVFVLCEGFEFKDMRADRIRIILSGSAAFCDYKSIEKYINEQGIGVCSAEIEIG